MACLGLASQPPGTLAILKRAVGLNPWHRSGHLHRVAEGGETAHIQHRIAALGDGLLRRLGDVEITRANAMLWTGHPAKALLSDFLVVLERILEDGCWALDPGDRDPPLGGEFNGFRRACWHPDGEGVL